MFSSLGAIHEDQRENLPPTPLPPTPSSAAGLAPQMVSPSRQRRMSKSAPVLTGGHRASRSSGDRDVGPLGMPVHRVSSKSSFASSLSTDSRQSSTASVSRGMPKSWNRGGELSGQDIGERLEALVRQKLYCHGDPFKKCTEDWFVTHHSWDDLKPYTHEEDAPPLAAPSKDPEQVKLMRKLACGGGSRS